MDRDWMRKRLEAFIALCEEYDYEHSRTSTIAVSSSTTSRTINSRMTVQMPTVREILKRLDPKLAPQVREPMLTSGALDSLRAVQQGLGILLDQDEWAANLAPDAPSLVADQLHPWVWDAARTFWDAGAYAVAVEQAAKSVTAHTQQKTACHLADDDLMSQLWSDDPPKADRPRLRFSGNRNAKTWQSRQRGARSLAQGCYGGIRNIVAHEHAPDWPQQLALEYLACLSVLARWINEAEVDRAA
jgi:uncharacterized protein (TIGR02391 family)